ncbi:competence protein CoiA family protein [Phytohabitans sp. LJ34]|uniref:competence protein CoiA family protein n=1 Tax=Phytohabitans sp. LJ34 TaxID=3452217 RepID=UPI003F8B5928
MTTTASDLLVVGLDLATGKEVHIDDAPLSVWHAKSFRRGDATLICHHCYIGDQTPAGTIVPLVVRGRHQGVRRAHFAHPPGMAPAGGHRPETLWHSAGKHLVARWAAALPNIQAVQSEHWLVDGSRRADVMVTFTGGAQLAVELQHQLLPDPDWVARHHAYTDRGIADVWLWHPSIRHDPRIVLREGLPLWKLDVDAARLAIGYGAPHRAGQDWYLAADPGVYDWHHPPCPGDDIAFAFRPLTQFRLDTEGILLPIDVAALLDSERNLRRAEAVPEAARRDPGTSGRQTPATVCLDPPIPAASLAQGRRSTIRIDCY